MPESKVQPKPQDLKEISYIGDDRVTYARMGGAVPLYNPDSLVGRKGLDIYDKMLEDSQVSAVQTMKKDAILQSGWRIEPASDSPMDKEIAEKVEWDFRQMKGTLNDRLRDIMTAKDYGFSVTEKIHWIINYGEYEGLIGLKDLKTRKPHSFTFNVDEFGNLKSLNQNALYGVSLTENLPPEKFVLMVNRKKFGNWFGEADLRCVYSHWWSKYNHLKWWNMYGERHGIPLAKATYEAGTPASIQDDLKNIVKVIQTQMSVMLPPGCNIEFIEAKSGGEQYFQLTIGYHDISIAKGLLMPQLLGMSTENKQGSYAQSKTHFDMFVLMIEMSRKQLEEEIVDEQIIRPLVDFNYTVEEYPRFKFNPLTKDDKFDIAKTWIEIVKSGLTVPDLEDENRLRELLNFDQRDELIVAEEPEIEEKEPLPDSEIPEEDMDKQSFKAYRQPDKIESKVDFARIERDQDKLVGKFSSILIDLFKKQKADFLSLLKKKVDKGTLNTRFVNKEIRLKHINSIQTQIGEFIRAGFNLGRDDLNREVKKSNFAIDPVLPKDALKFLEDKRFWITGIMNDEILNDVRGVMLEGIRTGASLNEMIEQVDSIYAPFIGDVTAIVGTATTTPFRIETVLRTNLSEVYNQGRVMQALSPELEDFVVGMEYSEIMDSRTVDVSKYVDGKKIKMTDPDFAKLSYPLHYNDRGVFVPVTQDDLPVEWITAVQKNRVKTLMRGFR